MYDLSTRRAAPRAPRGLRGGRWGSIGSRAGPRRSSRRGARAQLGEAVEDAKEFGWEGLPDKKAHNWETMVNNIQVRLHKARERLLNSVNEDWESLRDIPTEGVSQQWLC